MIGRLDMLIGGELLYFNLALAKFRTMRDSHSILIPMTTLLKPINMTLILLNFVIRLNPLCLARVVLKQTLKSLSACGTSNASVAKET